MLTLSLLHNHLVPVEAECISPNTLAGLAVCEIERLSVFHGNRKEIAQESNGWVPPCREEPCVLMVLSECT